MPGTGDPLATRGRVRRDAWLSAALFILSLAALVAFIVDILLIADEAPVSPALVTAAWVLRTIGQGLLAAGFLASGVALARRRYGDTALWRPGMLLVAAGSASFLVAWIMRLWGQYATAEDTPEVFHSASYFASMSLLMLSEIWRVAAALSVARLFTGPAENDVMEQAAQRSLRLGWVIAGGAAVEGMAALYWLISVAGPWRFLMVSIDGWGSIDGAFKFAGYAIAAATFIRAAQRFREVGATAYARRERLLLLVAIAVLVSYVLGAGNAFWRGEAWRDMISLGATGVAPALAALCAVTAFWLSAWASRGQTAGSDGPQDLSRRFEDLPGEE
jgi:hypothetical protein